jgi:ubiquinone/menaquinone biosynthesis C-methylase UbiE
MSSSRGEILEYLVTAESYDNLYREEQCAKYKCLLDVVETLEGLILDAGCGTGLLYEYLDETGITENLKYICLDPSREMLMRAKMKLRSPLVLLIEGYAEEIPTRSGVFDYVFSVSTWGAIVDKKKALSEFKRVVKPSGVVVVTGYPKTYTVTPTDLDSEFTEITQCIDYFYTTRVVKREK